MSTEEMISNHLNLARSCASKMKQTMPPDVSYDDLFSAALEGLWKASLYWQPERAKFSTYAHTCMKRCMIDWLRQTRKKKGQKVLREQQCPIAVEDMDIVDHRMSLQSIDDREEAEVALEEFKPPLASIIRDYFYYGYTMKEIARRYRLLYMTVVRRLLPFRNRVKKGACTS